MERHTHRVLSRHFAHVKQKLLSFAMHFDIANHGDLKGYGREALTGEFFQTHLPSQVEYLTGEIIDSNDIRSGQIDIIIQSKNSPKIPLWGNIHLSYSDSVIAAIEVKSDLNSQHLKSALEASLRIKSLKRNVILRGHKLRDLTNIPYIIFAFTGLSKEMIVKHIIDFGNEKELSLDQFAPDMVVVLNKDFYIFKNDGWLFPISPEKIDLVYYNGPSDENLVGLYAFLTNLIQAYHIEERLINVPSYFDESNGQK